MVWVCRAFCRLFSSGVAAKESGKPAVKAICPDYAGSRYKQAVTAICKKVLAGERAAEYEMGLVSLHGTHLVRSDPEKAVAWFEKAAQGDPAAQYDLAMSTIVINLKSYDTNEVGLLQSAVQGYAPHRRSLASSTPGKWRVGRILRKPPAVPL